MFRQGLRSIIDQLLIATVAESGSGDITWRDICRHKPSVAIVSSDIKKLKVRELADRIRGGGISTRLLVMMKQNDAAAVHAFLDYGAHGVLSNAATQIEIAEAIETVLRHEIYVSPSLRGPSQEAALATDQAANPHALSEREICVLRLVAQGASNKVIASKLGISIRTVESHRYHLRLKTGVRTSSELALVALRMKLISMD